MIRLLAEGKPSRETQFQRIGPGLVSRLNSYRASFFDLYKDCLSRCTGRLYKKTLHIVDKKV